MHAADGYKLARFSNDRSIHQIPFNASQKIITTNISLYINFPRINTERRSTNAKSKVIARLSVVSSYSGIVLPVNNTIVPVVTLTAPNGTESMTVDILLNINESHIERCYDSFLKQNHTFVNVPVNIYSPLMYTQLGQYDFTITLNLFTSDNNAWFNSLLRYNAHNINIIYTLTVNITNTGKYVYN